MDRINRILNHSSYLEHMGKIHEAEADRDFCRHNVAHFLDVARIAWIWNLEEGLGMDKEIVYAAALLHDIGRHEQYSDGTPHELSSARIAPEILGECGFVQEEVAMVADAIVSHRNSRVMGESSLRGLLYRADKASRACFACGVRAKCSWKDGKKNLNVTI